MKKILNDGTSGTLCSTHATISGGDDVRHPGVCTWTEGKAAPECNRS